MTESLFFPKTVHREVIIKSFGVLIGKAPEKAKRIKLQLAMPLSGKSSVGMPGWLGDAYEFVAKTNDLVNLKSDFYANLQFSADDLFPNPVKAPKSKLRKLAVVSVGSSDDQSVELQFSAYLPFATELLAWLGQFAGDSVWANFDLMNEMPDPSEEEEIDDEEEDDDETPATEEAAALFAKDKELVKPEHDQEFMSEKDLAVKKRRDASAARKQANKDRLDRLKKKKETI